MSQTAEQIDAAAERYYDGLWNRYHCDSSVGADAEFIASIHSDIADDGDQMDALIDWIVDDTSDLREVVLLASRMRKEAGSKAKPLDEAEVGRRFLALVHKAADKYAQIELEDAR